MIQAQVQPDPPVKNTLFRDKMAKITAKQIDVLGALKTMANGLQNNENFLDSQNINEVTEVSKKGKCVYDIPDNKIEALPILCEIYRNQKLSSFQKEISVEPVCNSRIPFLTDNYEVVYRYPVVNLPSRGKGASIPGYLNPTSSNSVFGAPNLEAIGKKGLGLFNNNLSNIHDDERNSNSSSRTNSRAGSAKNKLRKGKNMNMNNGSKNKKILNNRRQTVMDMKFQERADKMTLTNLEENIEEEKMTNPEILITPQRDSKVIQSLPRKASVNVRPSMIHTNRISMVNAAPRGRISRINPANPAGHQVHYTTGIISGQPDGLNTKNRVVHQNDEFSIMKCNKITPKRRITVKFRPEDQFILEEEPSATSTIASASQSRSIEKAKKVWMKRTQSNIDKKSKEYEKHEASRTTLVARPHTVSIVKFMQRETKKSSKKREEKRIIEKVLPKTKPIANKKETRQFQKTRESMSTKFMEKTENHRSSIMNLNSADIRDNLKKVDFKSPSFKSNLNSRPISAKDEDHQVKVKAKTRPKSSIVKQSVKFSLEKDDNGVSFKFCPVHKIDKELLFVDNRDVSLRNSIEENSSSEIEYVRSNSMLYRKNSLWSEDSRVLVE